VIVDLDTIGQAGESTAVLRFAERISSGVEVLFGAPVEGEIRLRRAGGTVWLDGAVATTVNLGCARCLRPIEQRLIASFHEGFRPGAPAPDEGEDEAGVVTLVGGMLDVSEVVRQHLVMALPMAPVCRPGCRGLCPICGADRNEVACDCVQEAIDPRLAVLQQFRPSG